MQLHDYQRGCLDDLERFFERVRQVGAHEAFRLTVEPSQALRGQTYRPLAREGVLAAVPHVGVKVPTGGGKTVMAAHTPGLARRLTPDASPLVVLWLAPSTKIVQQTLGGLRDRRDPLRQTLERDFSGHVEVMDLDRALHLSRGDLGAGVSGGCVVIVSSMAGLRVEDENNRRVYRQNGHLMGAFTGLSEAQREALTGGDMTPSLANLLRVHRPLVIVDEAHGFKSDLSVETLERVHPSAVVEFTATPVDTNVVTQATAGILHERQMLKLPVELRVRPQWRRALREAAAKRDELEELARAAEAAGGPYVRPIMLVQAESNARGNEAMVDAVREELLSIPGVTGAMVRRQAYTHKELDEDDWRSRGTETRYVITLSSLAEGWDCSFAYVLCTMQPLNSEVMAKQLLGRVLRQPYAKRSAEGALNMAYAYGRRPVSELGAAAGELAASLNAAGFSSKEAKGAVWTRRDNVDDGADGTLFAPRGEAVEVGLSRALDRGALPAGLRERVAVSDGPGGVRLSWSDGGEVSAEQEAALVAWAGGDGGGDGEVDGAGPGVGAAERSADVAAVRALARESRGEVVTPANSGARLAVPRLVVRQPDGEADWWSDQHVEEGEYDLADVDPALTAGELPITEAELKAARVGLEGINYGRDLDRQMMLVGRRFIDGKAGLVDWLDRQLQPMPRFTRAQLDQFLGRVVDWLEAERGLSLAEMVDHKGRIVDLLRGKLRGYLTTQSGRQFEQLTLTGPGEGRPWVDVDPAVEFEFPMRPPYGIDLYPGPHQFSKNFYGPTQVGSFDGPPEGELAVALWLDHDDRVQWWVRNPVRSDGGFHFPLARRRFWPDFVAVLHDGRFVVVEHKGIIDPLEAQKKLVGELWEQRSAGANVFCWTTPGEVDAVLEQKLGEDRRLGTGGRSW